MGLDPIDQRPLLARYDLARARQTIGCEQMATRRSGRLWRWAELLPVRSQAFIIYLGEGETPLQPARHLGSWLGLTNMSVKRESLNPTGSFKARGMAVAVGRAVELGAKHLVAASAGNAGGALAAYSAAAGVRATVIMPADAPAQNQVEVLATGAGLLLLEGLISDCGRLAGVIRDELGAIDLSTLKEPYRVEGKKTMGFELAEQLGWQLPDAIVYPTGGGTGIVGMWKAFEELEALDMIGTRRPRMFSVQAEGCAPIVLAYNAGDRFAKPWDRAATAAAGLRVPSAVGDFLILDCLRKSGGGAVAVPERGHRRDAGETRTSRPGLRQPGNRSRRGRLEDAHGVTGHRTRGEGCAVRHGRGVQVGTTGHRRAAADPQRCRILEGEGDPRSSLGRSAQGGDRPDDASLAEDRLQPSAFGGRDDPLWRMKKDVELAARQPQQPVGEGEADGEPPGAPRVAQQQQPPRVVGGRARQARHVGVAADDAVQDHDVGAFDRARRLREVHHLAVDAI